jgi:septum formation topological specificity factor MinE
MTLGGKRRSPRKRTRPITAADVGRYIRGLASLNRDSLTGNPELSEALFRLAGVLTAAKALPAHEAAQRALDQDELQFEDELDFEDLELEQVKSLLDSADTSKAFLLILAVERLGMARSRLEKMPREEIVRVLQAAVQHEESLSIISEEARRGGEKRAS